MLDIVRPYAQQIKSSRGISNADKSALGLTIDDASSTPVPAPTSSPILAILGATPGMHTLRFADSNTPEKRGKPVGAIGLQLFIAIAAAAVADPGVARLQGFVTRQPYGVPFDSADNGKIATYFARWQTRTGLTGPWSNAISFTVAA
jgi:hypothetical protein